MNCSANVDIVVRFADGLPDFSVLDAAIQLRVVQGTVEVFFKRNIYLVILRTTKEGIKLTTRAILTIAVGDVCGEQDRVEVQGVQGA